MNIIRQFLGLVRTLCAASIMLCILVTTTPIHVSAATVSSQSQTFAACNIEQLTDRSTNGISTFFSSCLTSILQFIVFIALIAMVIRIVIASIGYATPGVNANTNKQIRDLIIDSIIGILFLGGAGLFLSPLNPIFDSVNIFDLPQPGQTNSTQSISENTTNPSENTAPDAEQCEAAAANGEQLEGC